MSGATTVMPRTIQYVVELTNSVTDIYGPDPGSGSFMAGDVLVMILRVSSSGPFPIYAGQLSSIYRSYFTDHEGHLWMAYSGPRTAIAVFRNTGSYWHLESFSEMNAAMPQRPGLAPATVNTNAVVWMRPAVAPGSEIISMWAQVPNSGTSPAVSPGALWSAHNAVANTLTNASGQTIAGNLLLRTNAIGTGGRVFYPGAIPPAYLAFQRVTHILAVDTPGDLNMYVGTIAPNAGGTLDWPTVTQLGALFVATNGNWNIFVRRTTSGDQTFIATQIPIESGRAYRLSIIKHADESLGFYINNRLVATVAPEAAPTEETSMIPAIWSYNKTGNTTAWRWFKSQIDYIPDPWP
jgi:hypothetical protein